MQKLPMEIINEKQAFLLHTPKVIRTMLNRRNMIAATLAATRLVFAQEDFTKLPPNLPVPLDDGACDHLPGMKIPSLDLMSTAGHFVNLAHVKSPRIIVYAYPRTGNPGEGSPPGWDAIPGARGCTPQSCSMRDHYKEMRKLGAEVFGLSTQTSEYQREAATRLHLPFELLSDADLHFAKRLGLPTFSVQNWVLIKRVTLVVKKNSIEKVFYPVFPTDRHGEQIRDWLKARNT